MTDFLAAIDFNYNYSDYKKAVYLYIKYNVFAKLMIQTFVMLIVFVFSIIYLNTRNDLNYIIFIVLSGGMILSFWFMSIYPMCMKIPKDKDKTGQMTLYEDYFTSDNTSKKMLYSDSDLVFNRDYIVIIYRKQYMYIINRDKIAKSLNIDEESSAKFSVFDVIDIVKYRDFNRIKQERSELKLIYK